MKFTLIPRPRRALFVIQRRDVIYGKRATATARITRRNIGRIFTHEADDEGLYLKPKWLAYRDQVNKVHVRFWNEGDNRDRDVHHQDALADLLYAEAVGLKRLVERTKDSRYSVKAAKREQLALAQLALALNSVRQAPSEIYPEAVLQNAQGFKFTRVLNGKIIAFDIDSGVTRAQIRQQVVVDSRLLSELIATIHGAIAPNVRGYDCIRAPDFRSWRVSGEVILSDALRLVSLNDELIPTC